MADNCIRTPGTGETVLADEVTDATLGTGKVQLVKIMDGTLDGTDKCHVDATNGLAVEVKNSSIAGTAGSANAGVLSVQGIASMTPVQVTVNSITAGDNNIGNVDVVTLPALATGTNTIGKVKVAELGNTRKSLRVAITASATGTAIWTPTSGWRFVLTKLWVSAKTAGDIQLFDGTDSGNTVVSPIVTLNAGGGFILEWPADWPYRSAAVNNVLKFTTGTVITGSVYVEGWEEAS